MAEIVVKYQRKIDEILFFIPTDIHQLIFSYLGPCGVLVQKDTCIPPFKYGDIMCYQDCLSQCAHWLEILAQPPKTGDYYWPYISAAIPVIRSDKEYSHKLKFHFTSEGETYINVFRANGKIELFIQDITQIKFLETKLFNSIRQWIQYLCPILVHRKQGRISMDYETEYRMRNPEILRQHFGRELYTIARDPYHNKTIRLTNEQIKGGSLVTPNLLFNKIVAPLKNGKPTAFPTINFSVIGGDPNKIEIQGFIRVLYFDRLH